MNEGEHAIWWHDENGSTHIHGVTFPTRDEAEREARALGIPSPIFSIL